MAPVPTGSIIGSHEQFCKLPRAFAAVSGLSRWATILQAMRERRRGQMAR